MVPVQDKSNEKDKENSSRVIFIEIYMKGDPFVCIKGK
jgi:hypothetical protein